MDAAEGLLTHMLLHTPPCVLGRLAAAGCKVAIIGREQSTTDMPEHCHLKLAGGEGGGGHMGRGR